MQIPEQWRPLSVFDLQGELGEFTDWTLCGGYSIELLLGRKTRKHGDIDIGVFRSQVVACLKAIGANRVFLCYPRNEKVKWNGHAVDEAVHDVWISDRAGKNWVMQEMIFDDEGEHVFYRRDRRIHWLKSQHSIVVGSVRILNPMITFLYKANKGALQETEVQDISALIASGCALVRS